MTRAERTIVQHWRGIAVVCAIVALFGISWATWHRIDADQAAADSRYAAAASEADKRGNAVSTLAGDVRALRAQVQAAGKKPVAPDPAKAVDDLSKRAEVPVPIPGPSGAPGSRGPSGPPGKAAPTITPSAGPSGPPGATVTGPPGPPGAAGQDGQDGKDGTDGTNGSPPSGWSYSWTDGTGVTHNVTCTRTTDSPDDAPRYDCTDTSTETPPPGNSGSSQGAGLVALWGVTQRRTYA